MKGALFWILSISTPACTNDHQFGFVFGLCYIVFILCMNFACLCFMSLGLWTLCILNLLHTDPNYPSKSSLLQKASPSNMDPVEVQDLHSTLSSQDKLLGNHAQQSNLHCNVVTHLVLQGGTLSTLTTTSKP